MIRQRFRMMGIVAALGCGVAVTWAIAGLGYLLFNPGFCRGNPINRSRHLVTAIASGITRYQIDNDLRCPSRDDLVDGTYVARGALEDSWRTSITFHCDPEGDIVVRSAGPDRLFHTDDDITNGEPLFPSLTRARYLVAAIASVIESIRLTDGHCPTVSATRGYIGPHALLDPWGTTVIYQCTPEGDIVVRSAGPDVFFGTEDDITNDEPERIPDPKAARRLTAKVANAVQSFRNTEQRCPTPDQLVSHNYVVAPTLVDPWGTSMTIRCTPGGSVVVRSAGPDHLLETTDDITND